MDVAFCGIELQAFQYPTSNAKRPTLRHDGNCSFQRLRRLRAVFGPYIGILGLPHEQRTNNKRHKGYNDWIPEPGVKITRRGGDRQHNKGKESPKPTVTNMVRERH